MDLFGGDAPAPAPPGFAPTDADPANLTVEQLQRQNLLMMNQMLRVATMQTMQNADAASRTGLLERAVKQLAHVATRTAEAAERPKPTDGAWINEPIRFPEEIQRTVPLHEPGPDGEPVPLLNADGTPQTDVVTEPHPQAGQIESEIDPTVYRYPKAAYGRSITEADVTKGESYVITALESKLRYDPRYSFEYNWDTLQLLIKNLLKREVALYASAIDYYRGNNAMWWRKLYGSRRWETSEDFILSTSDDAPNVVSFAKGELVPCERKVTLESAQKAYLWSNPDLIVVPSSQQRDAIVEANLYKFGPLAEDVLGRVKAVTDQLIRPHLTAEDLTLRPIGRQFRDYGVRWDDARHDYVPNNEAFKRHLVPPIEHFDVVARVLGEYAYTFTKQDLFHRDELPCAPRLKKLMDNADDRIHVANLYWTIKMIVRLTSIDRDGRKLTITRQRV